MPELNNIERDDLKRERSVQNQPITSPQPLREPTIVSSTKAREITDKNIRRFQELQQAEEQRRLEEQQTKEEELKIEKPAEGEITPQEAADIFGGDLSGLELNKETGNFKPQTADPIIQKRVIRQRKITKEMDRLNRIINAYGRRLTPVARRVLNALQQNYQNRADILKEL